MTISTISSGASSFAKIPRISGVDFVGGAGREGGAFGHTPTFDIDPAGGRSTWTSIVAYNDGKENAFVLVMSEGVY